MESISNNKLNLVVCRQKGIQFLFVGIDTKNKSHFARGGFCVDTNLSN